MQISASSIARFTALATLALGVVGLESGTSAAPAGASTAPEWEINYAVQGTPPAGTYCTRDPWDKTKMCWEHNGDVIWTINYRSHWGTYGNWWNYWPNDSTLYRQGRCINKLGYNIWGYCNKNMHENSLVKFQSCDLDDDHPLCSPIISSRA